MLYENYNSTDNLSDKALVDVKTRKKIRQWVAIIHVLIIVGPLMVYMVMSWLEEEKPKRVFMARVVTLPPAPVPVVVKPQPKVKPKPKPVTKSKVKTAKPKVKKPVIKKPKLKTPVKVKPKPKPKPKSTWKPLDPNQINITKPKEVAKTKPEVKFDPKKLKERLKSRNKPQPVNAKVVNTRAIDNFYDSVGTHLYGRWTPPSASRLGGRHPKATVSVTINSLGRILSWSISKSSGFISVDESIKQLMNSVRQLPAPPSGIRTFDITLQVD